MAYAAYEIEIEDAAGSLWYESYRIFAIDNGFLSDEEIDMESAIMRKEAVRILWKMEGLNKL